MSTENLSMLAVLCNDKQRTATTSMGFHLACYDLALVQNDDARKRAEEQFAAGKPLKAPLLNDAAEAEAYAGHLRRAAEIFRMAVDSARAHA